MVVQRKKDIDITAIDGDGYMMFGTKNDSKEEEWFWTVVQKLVVREKFREVVSGVATKHFIDASAVHKISLRASILIF